MSTDLNRSIDLFFTKNQLEITATDQDLGQATETLEIQYEHDDLKIGFNVDYLMEGIDKCENEEIALKMNGSENALYIEESGEKEKYQYVLMPIKQ
jgi:DNA polymerase-3 subunit beta